ncbi:MAG: NAD-dependent protein deacylase [Chloroflexi bacterium]|nr:MAG: NAD-dependent protein deacylase [Chloroflexota bacterium]PIE79537.1 MAG: NAD-dependent protein deacylase [Chloroflexota bacterium]
MTTFPPELIEAIRSAKQIVSLTGAGISAESGVPTFRQAQTGLWAQYDPQELATPHAFRRNPKLVWEWYAWRRELVSQAVPNAGHRALVTLEEHVPQFTLITQNVDGLHEQAGSRHVIELHGNLMRAKCFTNGRLVTSWPETDDVPPRCPHCGGMLRPDVVWFGESLPVDTLETAVTQAQSCDVFLSIGTSSLVQPAASLPVEALRAQAICVEINPQSTPLTPYVNYALTGTAGTILPELVTAVFP